MKLYFENSFKERREITDVENLSAAIAEINKFCKERKFKIYYMRMWENGNERHFDVGSHTEFFVLVGENNAN